MVVLLAEEIKELETDDSSLVEMIPTLNRYLKQKLKGKSLLLGNIEMGKVFKSSDTCEVIYLSLHELANINFSLMKYHNVITHNFNHLSKEIQNIKSRCEGVKVRFIAFKES